MRLARNLRKARKTIGWTQQDMAWHVMHSRNLQRRVSDWECGVRAPNLRRLVRVAYCCGVTVDWLLDNEE